MGDTNMIHGDTRVYGNLSATTMTIPNNTVTNAATQAAAGIAASKLEHQTVVTYGQPNTAATDETKVIYCAYGATGDILSVKAGSIAAAIGDAITTVDVKKDGVTILTAPIQLDSGNAAYTPEAGTLAVTTFATTDVFTVVIDATIGTGTLPTGVYVVMTVTEDAA